ncbi:DUF2972 domain-containing protein [Campylobacter helveticus]|nr:DUF2972 domain-containing protein [Campylobacter helveticus]SUW82920.1 putative sugar transferase [Campylobacter helveticus]
MKEELGVVPNLEGVKANHLKKSLVSKEFQSLLKTSYIPLQNLILDNFAFILEHLELIYLWLNSKEFKDKYEKENYPYPPLLNPDILNELLNLEDEQNKETLRIKLKELSNTQHTNALSDTIKAYAKAGLDYRLIPAEKAWEMNLPLPRSWYECVLVFGGCKGHVALSYYLLWAGYAKNVFKSSKAGLPNPSGYYINQYKELNELRNDKNILIFLKNYEKSHKDSPKLYDLCFHNKDIYILTRDPISTFRTAVNHIDDQYISENTRFSPKTDFSEGLKWVQYHHYWLDSAMRLIEDCMDVVNIDSFLIDYVDKNRVFYIDFNEIYPNTMWLFKHFQAKYNFPDFSDKDFLGCSCGGSIGYLIFNGKILEISKNYFSKENPDCEKFEIYFYSTLRMYFLKNKNINVENSIPHCLDIQKNFIDVTDFLVKNELKPKDFFLAMSQSKFKKLSQDEDLFNQTKDYIEYFLGLIEKQCVLEDNKKKSEKDILTLLKKNKHIRVKLKNYMDKEFNSIKENRPDIVASWKYYQEFEKMCGEMKEG